ncbi:radical SAM protein [Geobacter argillaceus]|uniref:Radical SAM family protein n=1 Tax=Geobacter argillaceus TaxID=345631 RepID=A0A562WS62_9BACT|nr:radical SAM protein [Geobacter argillaceus]TWJ33157.1 radical SAM family protein [Geobacter argillaceus]
MKEYGGFEQGPIRPPSEASSLLIRVNRNCPWNRCTFCSIYKKKKFSLRPVNDVLQDIDTIRRFVDAVQEGGPGSLPKASSPGDEQALYAARTWIAGGMESIFLQDADGLVIRPENLLKILRHLKASFPQVRRITSYARSESVARIDDGMLAEFAAAGLNRIHIGMESASDRILELVRKGVTKEIHITAGLKVKRAGIELSEYVLTGLGGREFSQLHAVETADALNRINPDFIRFRNLHLPDWVTLFPDSADHSYQWAPDLVQAEEIHTLIERLDGITSCITSDHSYNLLQEIDGILPDDKARLLALLRTFIDMAPEQRVLFQVGKRSGHFVRLSDMEIPGRLKQVRDICQEYGITPDNVDERLYEIVQDRMKKGMPY